MSISVINYGLMFNNNWVSLFQSKMMMTNEV